MTDYQQVPQQVPQQVVQVNYQAPPKAGCEDADKCCCCVPIRTGAIILMIFALLNFIISVLGITRISDSIATLDDGNTDDIDYGTFKTTLVLSGISGLIGSTIAVAIFALWLREDS